MPVQQMVPRADGSLVGLQALFQNWCCVEEWNLEELRPEYHFRMGTLGVDIRVGEGMQCLVFRDI